MAFLKKIKNMFTYTAGFILYHCSNTKNHYPCRLIGEKKHSTSGKSVIIYRILGNKIPIETETSLLLESPDLISRFHPADAIKIGAIALDEFISEISQNKKKEKYHFVRDLMLNSAHDIGNNKKIQASNQEWAHTTHTPPQSAFPSQHIPGNRYPCKLVGGKCNHNKTKTTVIYTIMGKREGYEIKLEDLIKNCRLIEKFHPTEAIKFGFISMGENLFSQNTAS